MHESRSMVISNLKDLMPSQEGKDYRTHGVVFTGTPRKHPYDKEKIILIHAPLSSHIIFYEFRTADLMGIEEEANMVDENGVSLPMVKIWVRKGSTAVRFEPFKVDAPLTLGTALGAFYNEF
ncbi:MAG: hypothetical protein ACLFST_12325 [Spirochaetia bacterium]